MSSPRGNVVAGGCVVDEGSGCLSVFVLQQFEVIREYTDLDAVECHGASGVGHWNAKRWKEAIGTKEVRARVH